MQLIEKILDAEPLIPLRDALTALLYTDPERFWQAFVSILEEFADEQNLVVEDGPYGHASLTIFMEDGWDWDGIA